MDARFKFKQRGVGHWLRDPRYQHHVVPYVCPGRFLLNGPGEACLHDQFSCGILQHLLISIQSVSSLQFLQSSSDTEKKSGRLSRVRSLFFRPTWLAVTSHSVAPRTACLKNIPCELLCSVCLEKDQLGQEEVFFVSEKSVHEAMPWLDCLSLSRQPQIDSDDSQCGPDLIAISASTAETVAESVCPVWWN